MRCGWLLPLALGVSEAYARAGGGGGGGGGGRGGFLFSIIFWPLALIYICVLHYLLEKKNREARSLLRRLGGAEPSWDEERIKDRVRTVFFKVQEAWAERDQDIAREWMSPRLYASHKAQTDLMIKKGEKNVLKGMNLAEARIVGVVDYRDDAKDRFWAYLKGSMIDYTVEERTGRILKGDRGRPESFAELWKFVRGEKGWVLDEIDQSAGINDLAGFRIFSEGQGD